MGERIPGGARNRGLRVVGGGPGMEVSSEEGVFRWLLLTTQCRCHAGRLEAGCAGLGRMRHQDSCVQVHRLQPCDPSLVLLVPLSRVPCNEARLLVAGRGERPGYFLEHQRGTDNWAGTPLPTGNLPRTGTTPLSVCHRQLCSPPSSVSYLRQSVRLLQSNHLDAEVANMAVLHSSDNQQDDETN